MHFDEFLKILGQFGTYQKQRYSLICLVALYSVVSMFGIVFYGVVPQHHCKIPQHHVEHVNSTIGTVTSETLLRITVPHNEDGKPSSCSLYSLNDLFFNRTGFENDVVPFNKTAFVQYHISAANVAYKLNQTPDDVNRYRWSNKSVQTMESRDGGEILQSDRRRTQPCPEGRVYSTDVYQSTIVSEFDLSCENKWQLRTTTSVFFAGKLAATLLSGMAADRFGRRPVFLVGMILLALSGVALAFSPNMIVFTVLYVIQGASDACVFQSIYTLGMEWVGPKKRRIAGMGISICFGLGHSILALEAYFLRNWRHLALVASAPGVIFIAFWFFFGESVRWLLARGRYEDAKAIIAKVAKTNKVELEDSVWESLFKEKSEVKQTTHTFIDLFRTWRRAVMTTTLVFVWFSSNIGYSGLALNAEGLGANVYLNFALLGAADVPGMVLSMFLLDKIGRRKIIFFSMCVGGVACVLTGVIPKDMQWLVVTLALIGKMMIGGGGAVICMLAAESYPTVIRNVSLSFAASMARLGGVVAPQILLLSQFFKPLPSVVWGCTAISAGVMSLFLRETLGKPLPQTMEELDVMLAERSMKFWKKVPQSDEAAKETEMQAMDA
ncbi:organic cation transporter protein-like [Lingula anatina]|uniref:Organic cation transporter protein-like n=1 Tax=Lingula anatina TaxID=7574 RepID=A0A1S3IQ14_LINAN|nr:organic cation transporter protein-like [Lingula anatina]XP_013400157.1 organic cation transporter protein-like [Lingula anatina]XP_013400158.1 organic cation transporter protein-like [Lingula anatina]|eukprot:XP_013400156.1 organic cation transporter protein-like [Lingula anatina]